MEPGGILMIAVPNAAKGTWAHLMMAPRNAAKYFMNLSGRQYHYDRLYTPARLKPGEELHLSYFTPRMLTGFLAGHGFQILADGLDAHPAHFHAGHRLLFAACFVVYKIFRINLYPAFYVAARKTDVVDTAEGHGE